MPLFTYNGPEASVNIAGRHVDARVPTILEGRAADSARQHPDFEELGSKSKAAGSSKDAGASKDAAKPKATRSSTRKTTPLKAAHAKAATPAKSGKPSTPIVSSEAPTPASETLDPNDI